MITYLRQNTSTPFQTHDIYNLNASFSRKQHQGLSTNDALIKHLKEKGIHHKILPTIENRVSRLFIAYPESIKLAQRHQDVILVDCTNKSNMYNLPLLHMVGKCIYKHVKTLTSDLLAML
jgi:hypothetical protein